MKKKSLRSFQGCTYPNESLCSPLWIFIQWKQFNTPCTLRIVKKFNTIINMNVWLDITSEVFKGGRQIYIQMKAYVLPFENIISFLNLPNFIHTLKSLRVHRTPSSCRCSQWELINTTLWRNKINMNVWLDITSEVFKGGRQIYIQMKAYVLPFKNIISFLNLA